MPFAWARAFKGRSPILLKGFFNFFFDASYNFYESRSNSSNYGYYPYFILFTFFGLKGWLKINTNNFNGFRRCWNGWQSTRTHANSPHVNSYPCQLVSMLTRTNNRCQLVPQVMSTRTTSDVNSYPTRQVSDDGTSWHLLSHNTCQLVPMSTRTHVNSYH